MGGKSGRKRKGFIKFIQIYLIVAGLFFHLFLLWMVAGWPFYFDRWLIVSERPQTADYIVCLTAGLGANQLPTEDGWGRIYTACQLYFDGFAPLILFTGGGAEKVSEAEIYAEVARWFGCSEEAIIYEIGSQSTADHPRHLLTQKNLAITRDTSLLVVTSPLHSRRTGLCFRRQGFSNFRVVVSYRAQKTSDPAKVRELRESRFDSFKPSEKVYDDLFMRLTSRTSYFFRALRELAALIVYKIKGYI